MYAYNTMSDVAQCITQILVTITQYHFTQVNDGSTYKTKVAVHYYYCLSLQMMPHSPIGRRPRHSSFLTEMRIKINILLEYHRQLASQRHKQLSHLHWISCFSQNRKYSYLWKDFFGSRIFRCEPHFFFVPLAYQHQPKIIYTVLLFTHFVVLINNNI